MLGGWNMQMNKWPQIVTTLSIKYMKYIMGWGVEKSICDEQKATNSCHPEQACADTAGWIWTSK